MTQECIALKRIIVFRFHKLPAICLERIHFLRRLNPSIEIFGLFGGDGDDLPVFKSTLGSSLAHIYSLAPHSPVWKWRFSDLVFCEWFRNIGSSVAFDVAHLIEWDLLLCEPLDKMYAHIPVGSLGLTAIRPVKDVEADWQPTALEPFCLEWRELLRWARHTHSYSAEPHACLGPGYCLPRAFLESYSHFSMPELSLDELRLPLAAQLLGVPWADTRLCRAWFMEDELRLFNTIKKEVLPATVARELQQPKGRRAFHPVPTSFAEISSLIAPAIRRAELARSTG
jgi:hypothetical protein